MILSRKHAPLNFFAAFILSAAAFSSAAAGDVYGLPVSTPEAEGLSAEKLDAIPGRLQHLIDEKKVPGFITAVARNGKIVHFEAFGKMDVERDKPMRPDTIFRMYSMTKPITGVALMILVDEGKIAVDDPVAKYLPEFAHPKVLVVHDDGTTGQVPAQNTMRIKHLLTHTAGLGYGFLDSPVSELYKEHDINSDGASGMTLEEFSKNVAALPLICEPGTAWNYSVAMDVLGRVAEVVSGQRYGDFLQERIFGPLGMKDAGFMVPKEKLDRFAANYMVDNKDGRKMKLLDDPETSRFLNAPSQDSGGGGMVGTAADYLRFAQMLLNGGELDGVRVVSEKAVREMTTNQLDPALGKAPVKFDMVPIPLFGIGFGYCGAAVMEDAGQTLFGGPGQYTWGGLASTDFWIDRKEQIVGLILTQLVPAGAHPTRIIMNRAVYDALEESYGENMATRRPQPGNEEEK